MSSQMKPNFKHERQLWHRRLNVAGADEVGRGALAGPIVAAAVVFPPAILKSKPGWVKQVRDSKKLMAKLREQLYKKITQSSKWTVAVVSNTVIDKIGLQPANILVINKAVKKLKHHPDYLLLDYVANFKSPTRFKTIIKGDSKVFSIACAAIVAKVYRDKLMVKLHKKYPQYKWAKNKGYGSWAHRQAIKKFGLSPLHRQSFKIN